MSKTNLKEIDTFENELKEKFTIYTDNKGKYYISGDGLDKELIITLSTETLVSINPEIILSTGELEKVTRKVVEYYGKSKRRI
jgi:hypothetical protein